MAGEPVMTIVGNLTDEPELRFTPAGVAVANFTVAHTPRALVNEEWVDGQTTFFRCAVWREYAENVAASLFKGMRVIVEGRFKTRIWQDNDGIDRTSIEMDVDEVGPSLRFGTVDGFTKTTGGQQQRGNQQRSQGGQQGRGGQQQRGNQRQQGYGNQGRQQGGQQRGGQQRSNRDPWGAQGAPSGSDDPWADNQSEEPPY